MAQPITWRTVQGPSLAEASRPLEASARSMDGAFKSLGDIFARRQAIDDANNAQVRTNNTNDYMDRVRSVGTSAELDSQRAGLIADARRFGNGIDRQAVSSMLDRQGQVLNDRANAQQTFNIGQLTEAQRPIEQSIRVLQAEGKHTEAAALMAANPDLRNAGALAESGAAAVRGYKGDERLSANEVRLDSAAQNSRDQVDIARATQKAQAAYQSGSLGIQQQGITLQQQAAIGAERTRLVAEGEKAVLALGTSGGSSINTVAGSVAMEAQLKATYGTNERYMEAAHQLIGRLSQKPITLTDEKGNPKIDPITKKPMTLEVTIDAVMNALGKNQDNRWFTGKLFNNRVDIGTAEEDVRRYMNSDRAIQAKMQQEMLKARALEDMKTSKDAILNLPPVFFGAGNNKPAVSAKGNSPTDADTALDTEIQRRPDKGGYGIGIPADQVNPPNPYNPAGGIGDPVTSNALNGSSTGAPTPVSAAIVKEVASNKAAYIAKPSVQGLNKMIADPQFVQTPTKDNQLKLEQFKVGNGMQRNGLSPEMQYYSRQIYLNSDGAKTSAALRSRLSNPLQTIEDALRMPSPEARLEAFKKAQGIQ